jgi:tetratricopeptide (TPR) repeat protein
VYRAFDPQLERTVAIKKLLNASDTGEGRQRLLREAQAMAKLVHPNIVSVFDAGLSGDEVFLVMEYVNGPTLHAWLREEQRSWREVLRLFIDAGRGLEAAHAAGLVHRDFKPSNVLVHNGRAKVTDFGLALLAGTTEAASDGASESSSGASTRLTRAGATPGTPEYMAPEQFRGEFDARSDQFSFARALTNALRGRNSPRWVEPLLARALTEDPSRRWPSMGALLSAIDPERRARRNRVAALALGVVVLLGAGVSLARRTDCGSVEAPLDNVWTASVRDTLDSRLKTLPTESAARVHTAFASWVDDWKLTARTGCEASARGTQSEKLELLRRTCLERRLNFFDTLLKNALAADASSERLVDVGDGLTAGECGDTALLATGAADEAPALQQKLQPLRAKLDTVEALTLSGREDLALPVVSACLDEARDAGFAPFTAVPALLKAQIVVTNDPRSARELFREAFVLASDPRGSADTQQVAARAAVEYFDTFETEPQSLEALRAMLDGALVRTGNSERSQATYALILGRAALDRGDPDAAIPLFEKSVELRTKVRGATSADTLLARSNLAAAYEQRGDTDRSVVLYREVLDVQRARYGDDSLPVARALEALGADEVVGVAYADARKHLEEARRISEKHGLTPGTGLLDNLASMLEIDGDFAQARALRGQQLQLEHDPLLLAKAQGLMSRVLLALGQRDAARTFATQSIATLERSGATHPDLQVPLTTLGSLTRGAEGDALLTRALSLPRSVDHEYRGDVFRAQAERAQGPARRALLTKARDDYAEAQVNFRVRELDMLLK